MRGHFKDYSVKGLYGKYKKVYWWDSQVRGAVIGGVVDKDYRVKREYCADTSWKWGYFLEVGNSHVLLSPLKAPNGSSVMHLAFVADALALQLSRRSF